MSWPQLPCPSCKGGTLRFDEDSISKKETKSSKLNRSNDDWDPAWIEERFIAILTCANPRCEDSVFVCGKIIGRYHYITDSDGEPWPELFDYYAPRFFESAPPVFPIPRRCPGSVREELLRAFALNWSDVGSAGHRLRVAVETLMNECKIQKKVKIKTGQNKNKFRNLSLDERIKKFSQKQEDAATQLMAIKWLGNIGSHAGLAVLTYDDLLDAFEHFEYALDLIYVKKGAHLAKRAKHISNKKGSIRAKSKRKGQ